MRGRRRREEEAEVGGGQERGGVQVCAVPCSSLFPVMCACCSLGASAERRAHSGGEHAGRVGAAARETGDPQQRQQHPPECGNIHHAIDLVEVRTGSVREHSCGSVRLASATEFGVCRTGSRRPMSVTRVAPPSLCSCLLLLPPPTPSVYVPRLRMQRALGRLHPCVLQTLFHNRSHSAVSQTQDAHDGLPHHGTTPSPSGRDTHSTRQHDLAHG